MCTGHFQPTQTIFSIEFAPQVREEEGWSRRRRHAEEDALQGRALNEKLWTVSVRTCRSGEGQLKYTKLLCVM